MRASLSRRGVSVLVVFLAMVLVASSAAEDWLQFRGPGGQGAATKSVPTSWSQTENLVWKIELPGPGTSSPILADSKIYLTCYSGYNVPGQRPGDMEDLKRHLICLDRKDGKEVWRKEVPSQLPEQGRIREAHGYASNTPAVDKDRIYAFFGKSGVFAFDHNGKQLWRADIGTRLSGWGSAASPILHGELVIINASVESDSLVALDRKTGKEVWRAKGIRESWNTPILVEVQGRAELVVAITGKLLAFDPATGKQLWSCVSDINTYMVPSLVARDGVVYCIGGRTNGSVAVRAGGEGDVTETHRLWTSRKGSNVPSPVLHGDHLYWAHDNQGTAMCAEAKTGKVVYEERLGRAGQFYASSVLIDGKVYHISRDGRTFILEAKPEFKVLATNDLRDGSEFNASPAVADGRLYLRSNKFLYCIGEK